MKKFIHPVIVAAALALLSACGGTPPTSTPTPDPPKVSATRIQGTVSGEHITPGKVILATSSDVSFANVGTLDAAGTLTLNLDAPPEPESAFSVIPAPGDPCTYTGSGNRGAQVSYWNELLVLSPQGDLLGAVTQKFSDQTTGSPHTVARLYSATAQTFKGTVTCPDGFRLNLDLALAAGWNAVDAFGAADGFTLRDLPTNTTTTLQGRAQAPDVSVLLDKTTLDFKTDTLTVPATFFQRGAFSGTVHLSTDNDLLTVQPATLTLPALSAQGQRPSTRLVQALDLGAQRVDTTLTFKLAGNTSGSVNLLVKDDQGRELDRAYLYVTSTLPGFSLSTSGTSVLPGASADLPVFMYAQNGFSGRVTVTATGLPAGLSASTITADVGSGFTETKLVLTASSTLVPGTYPVTVTGASGTVRASATAQVTVPAPALSVSTSGATVYGGETVTLPVSLSGLNNFAGSVTLAVTGAPSGVTASTRTVTLSRNATVSTTLTLTGDAALTSGTHTLTLTATATGVSATQPFTLLTRVKRTALGAFRVVGLGSATGSGFWYVRRDEGSAVTPVLTRFDGTTSTPTVSLTNNNGYIYLSVLASPTGSVWLPGLGGSPLFKYANSTLKYWDRGFGWDAPPAVDAQGRLWAVVFDQTASRHVIARFNETTVTFESVAPLSWSSLSKFIGTGRDGSVMAAYDSDTSEVVTVDTSTLAVNRLSATGFSSISNITVDAGGTPWLYGTLSSYEPGIGKVGADGTVTITRLAAPFSYGPQVFAFDGEGTLWIAGSGFAGTLTPATGTLRNITVPQDTSASYALNHAGGVWQVWTEGNGTAYASLYK